MLADGTIVEASQTTNANLWLTLRGRSINFRIVTRFDLKTCEQGPFRGSVIYYPIVTTSEQLTAFYNFAKNPNYDSYSAIIQSFGFSAGQGSAAVNGLCFTKPYASPSVLQTFTAIEPQLASTIRIDSLMKLTVKRGAASPDGLRWVTSLLVSDHIM